MSGGGGPGAADRVWARDEEGATGQSLAWGQMPTGRRLARKAGPTQGWEGSGRPRGRPPQPDQDQVRREQPPEMLQEGLNYTLMDMVNRRAADKLAGRWHHQPTHRAHSPPSTPPQSPPRPPLGHLCPQGPTLSAPPELPEGGGVPPPRERLRPGSLPEGLSP